MEKIRGSMAEVKGESLPSFDFKAESGEGCRVSSVETLEGEGLAAHSPHPNSAHGK